jgi:flagellar biosynthesis/type III secretory pathway protein FliH
LKKFLETNASEVLNMLITEWNTAEYGEVQREEGREEGLQEGREEGLQEGRKEGLQEGREEGREEGQDMVLELLDQGYTAEQIRAVLAAAKAADAETSGK